ncbi:MAG: NUDIX hydrolase [Kangiellaceae bacterium]|nr:NUDIX hydrolase [Kangiellaceae bacterium]
MALVDRGGLSEEHVVVIKEFRAPANSWVLSLAAGMMDPDETDCRTTAIRELHEETGYISDLTKVLHVSIPSQTDPHKSTESMRWVAISVDASRPENTNPVANLDGAENIERVLLLPKSNLLQEIEKI